MKKLLYILAIVFLIGTMGAGTLYLNNNLVSIDGSGNMNVTGDLTYSYTHAVLSQSAGATYTVSVATQNVPVKLLPTFTSIEMY